ncbi:MAG: ABC transporter ATP-binding protein [Desulfobacteraceae bacterium]|nr:ABC transporter ATP-binding protein [Desulfobacteraceae bacterium]
MIEVEHLSKAYPLDGHPVKAVDDVSLSIAQGEFVSILGHSGSGKTTLLNLIGGLTRPEAGRVRIDGQDIWSLNDAELSRLRNEKMNFIFQFASLIPTLNVVDNVLLPATFGKAKPVGLRSRAMELLELMGLSGKLTAYPAQLSGGQQRRVAISRAFINEPAIVLADEPTGDLDEDTEREVLALFRQVNEKRRTTFLIVTHSSELAAKTDRRFRMTAGRLEII